MSTDSSQSLSQRDRMRRVVLLCCSFARNATFYRAGRTQQAEPFLSERHPEATFWRQVNGNFIDMAVLDWCKLFGDHKDTPHKRMGKHHWRRVVINPAAFEHGLHAHLRLDDDSFAALVSKMRQYRDEFIAHLDDGQVMHIPELDVAGAAIDYYHWHVSEHEAQPGDLDGLPTVHQFALGYPRCFEEGKRVYATRAARATA
jgi:hypothetical protein